MQNIPVISRKWIIIFLPDLMVITIVISFKITLFYAFQNLIKGVSAFYIISMIFVFSVYDKKNITRAVDAECIILFFPEKTSG